MNKLTSLSRSAVFALVVLGTITAGNAQVTYYNSGSSGTTITNLSVAGDGTGALTRMGIEDGALFWQWIDQCECNYSGCNL